MAGENLGSVYYTVDANAGTVADAKTQVASSTKSMTNNFKAVDTQVTKMSSSVKAGMNGVSRGAGQAGIQIQQFIGQVQGGQSAILAFSQQSTDLGFVLGFPLAGAIAGIAASIAGIFLPALFKANDAAEKLEKSIERVSAIATLSVDGVVTFGDAVLELSRYSEMASKQLIKLAIEQNEISKIKAGESLYESLKDISSLGGYANQAQALREIGKAAELSDGQIVSLAGTTNKLTGVKLDQFSNAYRDAGKSVLYLQTAVSDFKKVQNDATAKNLLNALDGIKINGKFATDEARDLATEVFKLTTAFFKGEDLSKKLADGIDIVQNSSTSLIDSLKIQVATLGASDRAIALHAASLRGATQAQFDEINTAYDAIEAYEGKTKAEKDSSAEAENNKKSITQINDALEDQRAKLEKTSDGYERYTLLKRLSAAGASKEVIAANIAELKSLQELRKEVDAMTASDKDTESEKTSATTLVNTIVDRGMTPAEKQKIELEELAAFYQQKQITTEQYESAITSIIKTNAEERRQTEIARNNLILSSSSQFFDAAAGLASTYAGEQSDAYKVLFGISKAFSIAQAAMNLSLAISQASTLPYPANIPAMAAAASSGAALISGIQGAAISGARLYGGYTAPNSMYKVNENGQAEMFSDGKNDFLMTGGSGGKVTSASDLGGSQPVINITTVNNASGTDVQVQQSTANGQTDIKFIIDTVAGNIASGGKVRTAITRSTSAKNKVV